MKKVFLAVLAIGAASAISGCGMLGGVGQCKFAKGEVAAELSADAKAFVEAAAEVKKIQLDWDTELAALATELKVEPKDVVAKLKATFDGFRAKGQCDIAVTADVDLQASFTAAASGKAGTGGPASGSASGSGSANVSVKVTVEPKCKAEGALSKPELDAAVTAVRAHFPKLFTLAKAYIAWIAKVPELKAKGEAALSAAGSDIKAIPEIKCAIETIAGVQADVKLKVDFSVSASAAVSGKA